VPLTAGDGRVYGDFAGTLTLRISDVTMTEAAAWVREAQQRFSTHPGLRGGSRSTARSRTSWTPTGRSPVRSATICRRRTVNSATSTRSPAAREGAAFGPKGTYWDVKAVNGDHNQKVGRMLGSMYSNERYFYGDTFHVDVLS
jgi:hypothetical protein